MFVIAFLDGLNFQNCQLWSNIAVQCGAALYGSLKWSHMSANSKLQYPELNQGAFFPWEPF